MHLLHTVLDHHQKQSILALWNAEYPDQLAYKDMSGLDQYLSGLQNTMHYLFTGNEGNLKAWGLAFTRDNERWFAMIVQRQEQNKGLGSTLMNALKQNETVLNGWAVDHSHYKKADGTPYSASLSFYLKKGFASTGRRLETEKLSAVQVRWEKQN